MLCREKKKSNFSFHRINSLFCFEKLEPFNICKRGKSWSLALHDDVTLMSLILCERIATKLLYRLLSLSKMGRLFFFV